MRLIDSDELLKHIPPEEICSRFAVANAPTIEPERKKGKWINDRLVSTNGGTYGVRRCSECEAYYQDIGYGWDFCPNCGADMRGENDD